MGEWERKSLKPHRAEILLGPRRARVGTGGRNMREEGTASGRSLVPTRDRRISALPRETLTALHRRDALADQWAVQREGGRATCWEGRGPCRLRIGEKFLFTT